jgi:mediator of RNA polymerase II transcription subunit 5
MLILADVRKEFSDSLGKFIPTLQLIPSVTERLEIFRSQTLAKLDPLTKNQEAANAAMESLIDSTVGLDSFFVPDIPISTTRAGLYIYLHAAVSTYYQTRDSIDPY